MPTELIRDCPNCGNPMHKVQTATHYGLPIVLDQCHQCGGLWFDSTEFIEVKRGEAATIENIDRTKLLQNVATRSTMYCPKDRTLLEVFKDPNFPSSIQIERCTSCGGLWFNHGEYTAYQGQTSPANRVPEKSDADRRFEGQVEAALRLEGAGFSQAMGMLGTLGQFLSSPVKSGYYLPSRTADLRRARQVDMIANVVVGLLSLFLRRK